MDAEREPVPEVAGARPATPASIVLALFLFGFAIAAPLIASLSVKDSHDGFQILGTFLLWSAAGGVAAFIGIICTIVGVVRGASGVATIICGALAILSGLILLSFIARM